MKPVKKIAVLAAAAFVLLGCSGCGNMVAKSYGGTVNIDLPVGEKLAEVTWKDNNTRPMREGEEAISGKVQLWRNGRKSHFKGEEIICLIMIILLKEWDV